MGNFSNRVSRLVVATLSATAIGAYVGASPAHALLSTTVDEDPIVVTENTTSFSGVMRTVHDGARLIALLSGNLASQASACGRVDVKFVYHDGSVDNFFRSSENACGTNQRAITPIPSDGTKDVVRYRFQTVSLTQQGTMVLGATREGLVGDAPDSTGDCTQIDRDPFALAASGQPTVSNGAVSYSCLATTGNIRSRVTGTVEGQRTRLRGKSYVVVTFHYTDETTSTHQIGPFDPGAGGRVSLASAAAKDVRMTTVRTLVMDGLQQSWGSPRSYVLGDVGEAQTGTATANG